MSRLNFGQANAVSSALTSVDDFVTEIRAVLNANGDHFLQYENRPAPSACRTIEKNLDALIEEARQTCRVLSLQTPSVDVERKVRHQAALLAAELADMKSAALKRYGRVDPAIAPTLDVAMDRIIAILRQLSGE